MSYKKKALKKYPNAICVHGTYGGFNVWLTGDSPMMIAQGNTAREAWKLAYRRPK